MTTVDVTAPPLGTVVVCHQEVLIGDAVAALIQARGIARHAGAVRSIAHLLSRLGRGVDAAVVFDGFHEEIADLFEAMRYRGAVTPILIVASRADADAAATVLEAGAAGVVLARCDPEEWCDALRDIGRGHIVIPASERDDILAVLRVHRQHHADARRTLSQLTAADIRILRSLCDGLTVNRIAERMLLSPHTVRGRVRAIGDVIDARGQLRIAAVGRDLLAAAKLPPAPAGPGERAR